MPRIPLDFHEHAEGIALDTRQKMEVIPPEGLSAKNTVSLNSLKGIRRETGRVYRAIASGRLASEEGTRRVFVLDKMRVMLEAEREAAVIDGTAAGVHGPVVDSINVIAIPTDWTVTPLFGAEAHMPNPTLDRLKELLPPDAFEPIIDPMLSPPIDDEKPANVRPVLRVHEGGGDDPEPPQAA
jgi:hypothetical protein